MGQTSLFSISPTDVAYYGFDDMVYLFPQYITLQKIKLYTSPVHYCLNNKATSRTPIAKLNQTSTKNPPDADSIERKAVPSLESFFPPHSSLLLDF